MSDTTEPEGIVSPTYGYSSGYATYVEEGGPMKVGWRDRIADWIESVAVGIAERLRPQRPWEGYGLTEWSPTITFLDAEGLIDNDPMMWEEVLVDDES